MKTAVPFSGMMIGAFELLKRKWKEVAVAVICFAMLSAVLSAYAQRRIDAIEETLAAHLGVSRDAFDTMVQQDVSRMSSLDMNEFMDALRNRGGSPAIASETVITREQAGVIYIARVGPYVGLLLILDLIIAFVAYTYFLLLFSRGSLSAYDVAILLPVSVLSHIGLILMMIVRSLIWIPLVGLLLVFYYVPRMALSSVILLSGESGIPGSISMSLRRTSRQWFRIVFWGMGLFIVLLLCLWPALVFVAAVGLFSIKLSYLFWLAALMTAIAFFSAAQTMLAVILA